MFGLLRKGLFVAPPEAAHELALESLKLGQRTGLTNLTRHSESAPVNCMGLTFANPVGLAAGMDKNGDYVDALGSLGFGFIEIGTITPRPQPGNPKPRVFRLPEADAMINRLGFNNKGVDHLVEQVKRRRYEGILGINIGKNFDTPNEQAVDDYLYCLEKVYAHADYITLNISSPNTKGLRDLQGATELDSLLGPVAKSREKLTRETARRVPIALKVAPDLEEDAVEVISNSVARYELDAVIATNTTIQRSAVEGLPNAQETGGLSGGPVFEPANQVLAQLREHCPDHIALIGVGGITSGERAAQKIRLGANLVQFYTGFVYRGPGLIADSIRAIRDL